MRLYIRKLSNELALVPNSSALEGNKALSDCTSFGQSQLRHQDNLLHKGLFNDCKNFGIWPARLEQLTEMILVYTCECKC